MDQIALNRAHVGRIEERKVNDFDIITMVKTDPNRID
jgi:hypothetical protein